MFGVCICPAAGPDSSATTGKAVTAAAQKIFMPCFPEIRLLETVRLAGLRRLQPIVPDRTAFGATIQHQADRDHATYDTHTPAHAPAPLATAASYGANRGVF